jgi:hypothetical protein
MKVHSGFPMRFAKVIPEHMIAIAKAALPSFEMRSQTMLPTPKNAPWGVPCMNRVIKASMNCQREPSSGSGHIAIKAAEAE